MSTMVIEAPPSTPPRKESEGRTTSISIVPQSPWASPHTRRTQLSSSLANHERRKSLPQRSDSTTKSKHQPQLHDLVAIRKRLFGPSKAGSSWTERWPYRLPMPRRFLFRLGMVVSIVTGCFVLMLVVTSGEPRRLPLNIRQFYSSLHFLSLIALNMIPSTMDATAKREWDIIDYLHLDHSQPLTLPPLTRVFHVAKEFGPATMGGLGVMLTSLVLAQAKTPHVEVSAILPHYSYLNTMPEYEDQIEVVAELEVPIVDRSGRIYYVTCPVSKLTWRYRDSLDFLLFDAALNEALQEKSIDVFLIGPGKSRPFTAAFKAKNAGDIYSAYRPLRQEWKDLWFASAAAEFIEFLTLNPMEISGATGGVDVVHLHGATNAMIAYYLRQHEAQNVEFQVPAIVYTLHDSLDEVEYSNLVANAVTFLPPVEHESRSASLLSDRLPAYVHSEQVFPSALAIDLADMVTFVSRSIASDIVEGRFNFALADLVMPSIIAQAKRGHFIGVTNALDFTDVNKNPFTASLLLNRGLAFPRVGTHDLLDPSTMEDENKAFVTMKQRAKQLLIETLPQHFSSEDLDRPLLLFIGRFQYNKGCEFFEPILEMLSRADSDGASSHGPSDARLIAMGARNNYPIQDLRKLLEKYPRHFTLIDETSDLQTQYGALIRMASDFSFVPSFSEAFGLVAAEGLLFGMPVISSGVGGLAEFLTPFDLRSSNPFEDGNAHLFQLYDGVGPSEGSGTAGGDLSLRADKARPSLASLAPAISRSKDVVAQAVQGWQTRHRTWTWTEREGFVRRLILDSLALRWDRVRGPVEEYTRIYDQALSVSRSRPIEARAHWEDHHPHFVPPPLDTVHTNPGIGSLGLPIYRMWSSQHKKGSAPINTHFDKPGQRARKAKKRKGSKKGPKQKHEQAATQEQAQPVAQIDQKAKVAPRGHRKQKLGRGGKPHRL